MRLSAYLVLALAVARLPLAAAERKFEFGLDLEGHTPPGFRSAVSGEGSQGDWRVILDELPPLLEPLTPQAQVVTRRPVLAQLAQDPTDEHFPMLIFDSETYDDFTFTTRLKNVKGRVEQMAGIAFRIQDERNFYVVRASSLGGTFRFYKMVNGQRGDPIGPEVPVSSGQWHELGIECKGNNIRCLLDGHEVIPPLSDTTFSRGKIGFWTKSDAVAYFCDANIVYTPREMPAQVLVRKMVEKYPRLLGLKVYVLGREPHTTRLVASKSAHDIGEAGGKTEESVISSGQVWLGSEKNSISVIMPLRDRNGEPVAAARVILKPRSGENEQSTISRAMPIVKEMQLQVQSLQDLVE
jgi:hypothetical protein